MGLFDFIKKRVRKEPGNDLYAFRGTPKEYFAELFAEFFPEYTVQCNVRLTSLLNEGVPVSFLLCRDGQRKLAVILCHSQDYEQKKITNTIAACQALGIPVQRYYTNFRNKSSYVRDRAGKALNDPVRN